MRGSGRRTILGLAVLVLAATGLQCTNSDVLSPAPGQLNFSARVVPAGSPKYESGSLNVVQVTVRPQDPAADAALGQQPYALLSSPVRIDLTNPNSFAVNSVGLTPGVYRVVGVRLQGPTSQDFEFVSPNPPPVTDCVDGVLAREGVDGKLPPPEIPANSVNAPLDVANFDPAPTFEILAVGQSSLTMNLDGTTFFTIFQDAFTCRPTGSCFQGTQTFPAPCMALYSPPTPDQLLPLVSFQ